MQRKAANSFFSSIRMKAYFALLLVWPCLMQAQVVNYVNNGSFEDYVTIGVYKRPTFWGAPDTLCAAGQLITPPFIPLNPYSYQWPVSGQNYFGTKFYCPTCTYNIRAYPRNRLKEKLKAGRTYCVKFYVNLTNQSTHGIDAIGAYLVDSSIDTITVCNKAITYLFPQISNPQGNILTDTLNWVPIKGLYTANGNEKYLVIGNFKNDQNTDTISTNNANLPGIWADYNLDDVSCIDIDLPAFAGRDTSIAPGDSIFLGREPDVGIDEACMWYQLPTVITSTTPALDTIAGFWIKPVSNSTFVVRQQLWCSDVKWDTVVIHMNPVGIEKLQLFSEELKLFPIPAKDEIQLSIFIASESSETAELLKDFHSLSIYNNLGLLMREEEIVVEDNGIKIKTDNLPSGVYFLQLKKSSASLRLRSVGAFGGQESLRKRFVIAR